MADTKKKVKALAASPSSESLPFPSTLIVIPILGIKTISCAIFCSFSNLLKMADYIRTGHSEPLEMLLSVHDIPKRSVCCFFF